MDDVKTFILFSALFKYNGSGLHKCIDTIKDMFCIKPGYAIYADEYVPTVTIFENKADNPKSISIIIDKGFYTIPYNALVLSCKSILAYILVFIMKRGFDKVADAIKNNNAVDAATSINKFINENEKYYDVKNVIDAAIKNSDIDIEKLCESLNL
nr:MAG: hypothetical protein [Bacteriophage sp.]